MRLSHHLQVKVPVERLWSGILTMIEVPLCGEEQVEIVERPPGSVIRRCERWGAVVVERLAPFARQHQLDQVLLTHEHYAGQIVWRLEPPLQPGLSVGLSVALHWQRRDRRLETAEETDVVSNSLREALRQLKEAAEA